MEIGLPLRHHDPAHPSECGSVSFKSTEIGLPVVRLSWIDGPPTAKNDKARSVAGLISSCVRYISTPC